MSTMTLRATNTSTLAPSLGCGSYTFPGETT
jgi:hypothetical protein